MTNGESVLKAKNLSRSLLLSGCLLTIYLFILFFNTAATPLFDVDEGAFSEATRNMVATGNYVTTYLDGVVRFDKPILSYWFQSAGVALLGVTELAFRLPSLLATLLWICAVGLFVRRYDKPENAVAAAIMTGTALGVLLIGRAATADALLNLFLVLALFEFYRFSTHSTRWSIYRVYFWMGLGVLTKGPIAILIPLATGLLFLVIGRRWNVLKKGLFNPVGWLILLAVVLPWYIAEYLDQGQAFINGFFFKHNIDRFAAPMEQHSGSYFYYLPVALMLILPFSGLVLPAFYQSIRRAIRREGDSLDLFLWCWFGFVLVFFSLSGTKLPHYMIYGVVPLIIITIRHGTPSRPGLWLIPPALCLVMAVASLPLLAEFYLPSIIHDPNERALLPRLIGFYGTLDYLLIALLGVFLVITNVLPHISRNTKIVLTGLACSACLNFWLIPAAGHLLQTPIKNAALFAQENITLPIVQWGVQQPSFSVYRGEPTPRREPRFNEVALTRRTRLDTQDVSYTLLFEEGDTVLIQLLPPSSFSTQKQEGDK